MFSVFKLILGFSFIVKSINGETFRITYSNRATVEASSNSDSDTDISHFVMNEMANVCGLFVDSDTQFIHPPPPKKEKKKKKKEKKDKKKKDT